MVEDGELCNGDTSSATDQVIVFVGACWTTISFEKHLGLCFIEAGPIDGSEKEGEKSPPLVLFDGLCDLDLPLRDSCVNETFVESVSSSPRPKDP